MPFEVYTGPKKRRRGVPQAAVGSRGRIMFNRAAVKTFLEGVEAVLVGYDKEAKRLGLIPVDKGEHGAFPVRYTTLGASVAAKKALDSLGVVLPTNGFESRVVQKENDYIIIQLD